MHRPRGQQEAGQSGRACRQRKGIGHNLQIGKRGAECLKRRGHNALLRCIAIDRHTLERGCHGSPHGSGPLQGERGG